jgi:hypothetical protein
MNIREGMVNIVVISDNWMVFYWILLAGPFALAFVIAAQIDEMKFEVFDERDCYYLLYGKMKDCVPHYNKNLQSITWVYDKPSYSDCSVTVSLL